MPLHHSRLAEPIAGQDLPRLVGVKRARTPGYGLPERFDGSGQTNQEIGYRHDPGAARRQKRDRRREVAYLDGVGIAEKTPCPRKVRSPRGPGDAQGRSRGVNDLDSAARCGRRNPASRRRREESQETALSGSKNDARPDPEPRPPPLSRECFFGFELGKAVPGDRSRGIVLRNRPAVAGRSGGGLAGNEQEGCLARRVLSGSEQALRPGNVDLPVILERARLDQPRHVHDRVATPEGAAEKVMRPLREVSGHDLDGKVRRKIRRSARERTHRPSTGAKGSGNMATDETRASSQERDAAGHGGILLTRRTEDETLRRRVQCGSRNLLPLPAGEGWGEGH